MRRRRQHRAQHHEIDAKLDGARELGAIVARCRTKHFRRPLLRG